MSSTLQAIATSLGLLGALAVAAPLSAATLADRMRAGDPTRLVDELASLGRTIDLSEPRFVYGAIGDVQGIPVTRDQQRDNWEPAFTRYEFPAGDIIYTPFTSGSENPPVR